MDLIVSLWYKKMFDWLIIDFIGHSSKSEGDDE